MYATAAQASCGGEVAGSTPFPLPRELKLKQEALDYMLGQPADRVLIESLSRIFAFATPENLELVSAWLRDTPPESPGGAMSDFPLRVRNNFQLIHLNLGANNPELEEGHQLGLATLCDEAAREIRVHFERVNEVEPIFQRLEKLMAQERYRKALAAMMSAPQAKERFAAEWTKRMPGYSIRDFGANWSVTAAQLQDGRRPDRDSQKIMDVFFINFFGNVHSRVLAEHDDVSEITFESYSGGIERVLAQDLRVSSSLNDIRDLLLYAIYEVPLPSTPAELRKMMIDNANRALLPIKSRYAQYASQIAKNRPPSASPPAFELKQVDFFEPTQAPHVRAPKVKTEIQAAGTADHTVGLPDLKGFSRFVDRPLPLHDLSADTTYQLQYLREVRGDVEKAVFAPDAVDWLKRNDRAARTIFDALNMGYARAHRQNGIKRLFNRSPHVDGPIFEIKNSTGFRPLMIRVDGVWQVLTVVAHEDVDRAIAELKPLD